MERICRHSFTQAAAYPNKNSSHPGRNLVQVLDGSASSRPNKPVHAARHLRGADCRTPQVLKPQPPPQAWLTYWQMNLCTWPPWPLYRPPPQSLWVLCCPLFESGCACAQHQLPPCCIELTALRVLWMGSPISPCAISPAIVSHGHESTPLPDVNPAIYGASSSISVAQPTSIQTVFIEKVQRSQNAQDGQHSHGSVHGDISCKVSVHRSTRTSSPSMPPAALASPRACLLRHCCALTS